MDTNDRRLERLKNLSPSKRALLLRALQSEAVLAGKSETIPRRPERGVAPLSFAQQRLLFIDHLYPGNPAYNIPAAVRLQGPLQVSALERSFKEEVRRHEALQTTFGVVNGEPVQVISPSPSVRLPLVDLSDLPDNEREVAARDLAKREGCFPFHLDRGPLVRLGLLRLSESDHIALLTMHHIISDGWSIDIFIRELATLYEAFAAGQSSPLLELPIQYADYAYWQTHHFQGTLLDAQLAYWKKQLGGVSSIPKLPTDLPRPAMQTFHGARRHLSFDRELMDQLEALGRRLSATLFIMLLTVFNILLYVFGGQPDIVVGTPVNNRKRIELEPLIGLFVNTLVLRTSLSGNPNFEELLARVREVVLGAHANQDLPFETLVKSLQQERDIGHTPLFQVWFLFQVAPPETQLSALKMSGFAVEHGVTHYDLRLNLLETSQGISGTVEYNTDLFKATTIERLVSRFDALLQLTASRPEMKLNELADALFEGERQRRLKKQSEQKQTDLDRLKNIRRRAISQSNLSSEQAGVGNRD